jgi:hypothetical protein
MQLQAMQDADYVAVVTGGAGGFSFDWRENVARIVWHLIDNTPPGTKWRIRVKVLGVPLSATVDAAALLNVFAFFVGPRPATTGAQVSALQP